MYLGSGVWGLYGIHDRRVIFLFCEKRRRGVQHPCHPCKYLQCLFLAHLNNEPELCILIYREIYVFIFYFEGQPIYFVLYVLVLFCLFYLVFTLSLYG